MKYKKQNSTVQSSYVFDPDRSFVKFGISKYHFLHFINKDNKRANLN